MTSKLLHIILHNYDIYLESTKYKDTYVIDQPIHSIIMVQTDFYYMPDDDDWSYQAILCRARAFSNGYPDFATMTTSMVMEKNRLRGLRCEERHPSYQPTPLQMEMLKRSTIPYLKMFISIHPYLLLDKKFKVKGDKKVLNKGREIPIRNSINCVYYAKTVHLAVVTVQRLK